MDESIGYAAFGKATLKQPQQQVALIFFVFSRQAEKRIGMSMTLFEKAGGGLITADGIDDLAVKLGVPAGVLKETVQSFNAKVRADGTAPEAVPPKSHLAAKLDMKGRLYAFYPLTPSITMVYGGLTIDTKARVTAQDGDVMRGLYAAGETVNLYYMDYHGGGILSQCLAFGRVAGEGAAKLAGHGGRVF